MESIEIKVDQLQESKPVKFTLGSEDVCVARIGDEIECWLHGAEFDLRSGDVLTPPAFEAIETYAVVRDGDTVTISKKK